MRRDAAPGCHPGPDVPCRPVCTGHDGRDQGGRGPRAAGGHPGRDGHRGPGRAAAPAAPVCRARGPVRPVAGGAAHRARHALGGRGAGERAGAGPVRGRLP
jgi:hypothetical protein